MKGILNGCRCPLLCTRYLGWKNVFNVEQNTVSYDPFIVVDEIAYQTRRWRHLWGYRKLKALNCHFSSVGRLVKEDLTTRHYLKRKTDLVTSKNSFVHQNSEVASLGEINLKIVYLTAQNNTNIKANDNLINN